MSPALSDLISSFLEIQTSTENYVQILCVSPVSKSVKAAKDNICEGTRRHRRGTGPGGSMCIYWQPWPAPENTVTRVQERAGFSEWVSSGLFPAIISSSFSAPNHYVFCTGFLSCSQTPARTSPTRGPSARPVPPSPARSGSVIPSRMSLGLQ